MEQTFKFKIHSVDKKDLFDDILYNQTGLLYKVFNHLEEVKDENFIDECLIKFKVDKTIYDYCVKDAMMQWDSYQAIKKEKENKLIKINKRLSQLSKINKLSKKEKYEKKKLLNTKTHLLRSLKKGVCFGGKALLRQITKIQQKEIKTKADIIRLRKLKKEYKQNRERNVFLWGKAVEGGNRKMDFHLDENYVIYKPNNKTRIRINLVGFTDKKRKNIVLELQRLSESNDIAISVRICRGFLCITFDNETLHGYSFDIRGFNLAVKENPLEDKKKLKKEFHDKQKQHKLSNKVDCRVAGVDKNPSYIGFSISDIDKETGEITRQIIHKTFDLSYYTSQKNLSSKDRNKLKYEIVKIYDYIFKMCKHYKVAYFGSEDLNKITDKINLNSNYFNRITKNVWYRELQDTLIKLRADEQGIIHEPVDPQYTSFIGNIKYDIYDPSASSIEISRRAFVKYMKEISNRWYPRIDTKDYEKLSYLTGQDVSKHNSWLKLYKLCKTNDEFNIGGWWRNKNYTVGGYLNSYKSNVNICI